MACNSPATGSVGKPVDWVLRQGDTFGPHTVTLRNPDESPVDLTGSTIRGQMRKHASDEDPAATFDCAITDATAGIFTVGLTASATGALTCGDTPTHADSRYVYDFEMVDTLGRVITLLYGVISVLREVTRGG